MGDVFSNDEIGAGGGLKKYTLQNTPDENLRLLYKVILKMCFEFAIYDN